ncbi:DUF262 domain-containing protein [Agrobacterium sp. Azo12]|uniref:DUF262 domain-containing protein n=1 Tax=Agrobacterium sp. Azo12 TaxID=3031129 RepID=UPI0023D861C7|nr:DUF262 domain-containing HNH endonuclease family protein [Agrobacterium sp. Azo12]MDO5897860.1 DUF262 domain-containing HNH endonuclease family protein [Agrobacterium sp. Azo12]
MHLTSATLFSGRLFRIPEYQRAYAWGSRQRADLFGDILDIHRSGREHFMATVVALARDARVIGAEKYTAVEIVDGQQRITTLVILLKAIEKSLVPGSKAHRDISELLVKDDDRTLLLLQTNHDSSSVFTRYILTGDIAENESRTAADRNVLDAAIECEKFVEDWKVQCDLIELVSIIRNQLSFVYHELADEATVYRVFEVLNSRGLEVKWIDKLKSQLMALLFEHIEEGSRSEAVKEMQRVWGDIYRTLGLDSKLGDDALKFAGTWAQKTQPNRVSSQEDAAVILTQLAGTKLNTIMESGERLKLVVGAIKELDENVRLRTVTKIAHARFVATAILLRRFDSTTRERLLGAWERVTFRIFVLAEADTRHKVGEYIRLGYAIFSANLDADEIEKRLFKLGSDYSLAEKLNQPSYWNNSYEGWAEPLRYILFRYEEHLAEANGQKLNKSQWNKIWAEEPSKSIEHIEPQSSGASYIHHLGNLTMLPPGVNSSLKDKPPVEKAERYLISGLTITTLVGKNIVAKSAWTEEDILARGKDIDAFVRKEWG